MDSRFDLEGVSMGWISITVAASLAVLVGLRLPLYAQGNPDMGLYPNNGGAQADQPGDNGDAQANPDDQGDKDENAADPDQDPGANETDEANADNGDAQNEGDADQADQH